MYSYLESVVAGFMTMDVVAELEIKIKEDQTNIICWLKNYNLPYFLKNSVFLYVFLGFSTRIWSIFMINLYNK